MARDDVDRRCRRSLARDAVEEPASLCSAVRAVWADFGDVLTAPGEADAAGLLPPRIGTEPAQLLGAMATVARTLGTEDNMEPLD